MKPRDKERNMDMLPAMSNPGEGVAAASGLTAVAMLDEAWELGFLQTALYVEESYLSMGDEVEKGTAVFTVSDKTLKKARKELEDTTRQEAEGGSMDESASYTIAGVKENSMREAKWRRPRSLTKR